MSALADSKSVDGGDPGSCFEPGEPMTTAISCIRSYLARRRRICPYRASAQGHHRMKLPGHSILLNDQFIGH